MDVRRWRVGHLAEVQKNTIHFSSYVYQESNPFVESTQPPALSGSACWQGLLLSLEPRSFLGLLLSLVLSPMGFWQADL